MEHPSLIIKNTHTHTNIHITTYVHTDTHRHTHTHSHTIHINIHHIHSHTHTDTHTYIVTMVTRKHHNCFVLRTCPVLFKHRTKAVATRALSASLSLFTLPNPRAK